MTTTTTNSPTLSKFSISEAKKISSFFSLLLLGYSLSLAYDQDIYKNKHKNKIFIKTKSNDVIRERSENKKKVQHVNWMNEILVFAIFEIVNFGND